MEFLTTKPLQFNVIDTVLMNLLCNAMSLILFYWCRNKLASLELREIGTLTHRVTDLINCVECGVTSLKQKRNLSMKRVRHISQTHCLRLNWGRVGWGGQGVVLMEK